jgi:uncharacterized protein YcaQ
VERSLWNPPGRRALTFEYWAHAACVMPVELWPITGVARRRSAARDPERGDRAIRDSVLARIRDEGPMTVTELGGARAGGTWWSWSPVKIAAEVLFYNGVLACTARRGFKRVYDLAERVIPPELLGSEISDAECYAGWVRLSLATMGVATIGDMRWHFHLKASSVRAGLAGVDAVPVRVEGWDEPAWADPEVLHALEPVAAAGRNRTTLISPFDSLLWYRGRVSRIFGMDYQLEAYVPAPKRVHGYYTMPLLHGGHLVGRVDPAREGRTLVARRVSLTRPGALPAMARALRDAAEWVGCDSVSVSQLDPPELLGALREEVARIA